MKKNIALSILFYFRVIELMYKSLKKNKRKLLKKEKKKKKSNKVVGLPKDK